MAALVSLQAQTVPRSASTSSVGESFAAMRSLSGARSGSSFANVLVPTSCRQSYASASPLPNVELVADPGAGPAVAGGGGVPVVTCP